ncbi:MAG: hypothetical protein WKF66_02740 [Pedobacter sp.]
MKVIKVGILISYDYEYAKTLLPLIYDHVDEIYFAVDVDRLTWAGEKFEIKEEFWSWVSDFDVSNKITIYQDKFYQADLTAMQCDTRERNLLGKQMGISDWYLQIDSDEYFVDFAAFVQKLLAYNPKGPVSIDCRVATLFKKVENGFLIISESTESLSFATNNPVYDLARDNESGNVTEVWDDLVLHQSWARSPEEIYLKLRNWSHKDDFNTGSFYKLWNAIDEHNSYALRNFHPLTKSAWPKLRFFKGTIDEIIRSESLKRIHLSDEIPAVKKSVFSRVWKEIKSK